MKVKLIFDIRIVHKNSLALIGHHTPPHFVYDFSRKIVLMFYSIN